MELHDQDRGDGYMELEVESDADIWHLKHVVEPGDTLRMSDLRTTLEGGQKRRCTLTLEVEKVDYQGGRLRATGEITHAPEDVEHGYHTFNLEPGVTFELWKPDWKDYQLDRVETAAETVDYEVLVCMIDSEGANFAVITETGIQELSDVESGVSGKMYADDRASETEFYDAVIAVLREYSDVDRVIVAGPGFAKENLVDRIEDEQLQENVALEDASTTGKAGVQEVLKRGAVKRVLHESRISDEVAAVEELLTLLKTEDEKTAYGLEAVRSAVEMGAVDTLLISDAEVREHEDLMERVEQRDGAVTIVHEDHDAGKKLASLGGIAATLRYRID